MNRHVLLWILLVLAAFRPAFAAEPFPATVTVEAKSPLRPVPPLLFGHNNEWTNSGDGFWDTAANAPRGPAVALARTVQPGLIRFPGGSLSNDYHWANAIGPVGARKPGTNYTSVTQVNGQWTVHPQLQPSVYGFDEHMRLVKALVAAGALVTVNATDYPGSPEWSGSAPEAAAWVAYANARADGPDVVIGKDAHGKDWRSSRYWARQRAANGHPAPYGVRFWEIGNEVDDPGQGAGLTGPTYARRVHAYGRAMRAVDPKVQIGAVLGMNWLPADILRVAGGDVDFLIYHFYGPHTDDIGATLYSNGVATATVEGTGRAETLTVEASGTPADGVWPEMTVSVDGRERGRFTVDQDSAKGQTGHYPLEVTLEPGPHTLEIAFTNDVQTATEDRNLFIRQVTLGEGASGRLATFATPAQMMQRVAALPAQFAGGFDTVRAALHRYAPMRAAHIRVFVTEFNAMYTLTGTHARQIKDLKSALLVDSLLQKALAEPLCLETNYWSLTSWWFRIVEPGSPPYLSPSGGVYHLMTPLHQGQVLRATVQAPSFRKAPSSPAVPLITAIAVRQSHGVAVNLVNFSPDQDARLTLVLHGLTPRGAARLQWLTGPTPEATNEPDAPRRVQVTRTTLPLSHLPLVLTLPAHSAVTIELRP